MTWRCNEPGHQQIWYWPLVFLTPCMILLSFRCILRDDVCIWKFHWSLLLRTLVWGDYVFSSFPLCPLPQQLLPLKSKLFELNLTYLAQRIYGSGEMYWMTFPWPWPKVTAVASISKNVLFCTIKWELLIVSLQNSFIALVMVITWLDFGAVLLETVILANFL